jgi:hypothetical protein
LAPLSSTTARCSHKNFRLKKEKTPAINIQTATKSSLRPTWIAKLIECHQDMDRKTYPLTHPLLTNTPEYSERNSQEGCLTNFTRYRVAWPRPTRNWSRFIGTAF